MEMTREEAERYERRISNLKQLNRDMNVRIGDLKEINRDLNNQIDEMIHDHEAEAAAWIEELNYYKHLIHCLPADVYQKYIAEAAESENPLEFEDILKK